VSCQLLVPCPASGMRIASPRDVRWEAGRAKAHVDVNRDGLPSGRASGQSGVDGAPVAVPARRRPMTRSASSNAHPRPWDEGVPRDVICRKAAVQARSLGGGRRRKLLVVTVGTDEAADAPRR
jgi:hypothetical protein